MLEIDEPVLTNLFQSDFRIGFVIMPEHVHLLVRSPPKLALSVLYGQMKGFCSRAWNKRRPGAPIGWQDGVYSITVDPDNCTPLREYIRSQWQRHEQGDLITRWEPPEITR